MVSELSDLAASLGSGETQFRSLQLLIERLKGKVDCDNDTSRRLFTLVTALHWKG